MCRHGLRKKCFSVRMEVRAVAGILALVLVNLAMLSVVVPIPISFNSDKDLVIGILAALMIAIINFLAIDICMKE